MGIVDDERRAARADLAAGAKKKAEAQQDILAAVRRCRAADIPVATIAKDLGVNRGTVYEWMKVTP